MRGEADGCWRAGADLGGTVSQEGRNVSQAGGVPTQSSCEPLGIAEPAERVRASR